MTIVMTLDPYKIFSFMTLVMTFDPNKSLDIQYGAFAKFNLFNNV